MIWSFFALSLINLQPETEENPTQNPQIAFSTLLILISPNQLRFAKTPEASGLM